MAARKKILLLGAGMSSSSIIRYLLEHAQSGHWQLRVVDVDVAMAKRKVNGHPLAVVVPIDALNKNERFPEIKEADLVISMLPARFHAEIALDCLEAGTNLITPSYVSPEMKALHEVAVEKGVLFMNEMGVDPGIDHMSACQLMDEIRAKGGELLSFRSFCGGLIAPESDNNPWNYKFTWNPRNVVLAGQGGAAKFIRNGEYKYIPYNQLFKRIDHIHLPGYGDFEAYANRDSLSYRSVYNLPTIPTMYRGTLRRAGFSKAWSIFVDLGMTDDTYIMDSVKALTPRRFLNAFLPYHPTASVEEKFRKYWSKDDEELYKKFEWLGFFNDVPPIPLEKGTPAQYLEALLKEKWKLSPEDKDMLVMYHEMEYSLNDLVYRVISYMVDIGEDAVFTSMSNTVGLPVAILAKLMLEGKITLQGVRVPVDKQVYEPVLHELAQYGICFREDWQSPVAVHVGHPL